MWIALTLAKTSSVILANLVIGENVIPEFMQRDATPGKLAPALRDVLEDTAQRQRQLEALRGSTPSWHRATRRRACAPRISCSRRCGKRGNRVRFFEESGCPTALRFRVRNGTNVFSCTIKELEKQVQKRPGNLLKGRAFCLSSCWDCRIWTSSQDGPAVLATALGSFIIFAPRLHMVSLGD